MSTPTVYDLLTKACQARQKITFHLPQKSTGTKTTSKKEAALTAENRVNLITRSDQYLEAARERWLPVLKNTNATVQSVARINAEIGTWSSHGNVVHERTETDTHMHRSTELIMIAEALQAVVEKDPQLNGYGVFLHHVFEREGGGEWGTIPDHRLVLRFKKLEEIAAAFPMDNQPRHRRVLVSEEDKKSALGKKMFKEEEGDSIPILWPSGQKGEQTPNTTKVVIQITTQMHSLNEVGERVEKSIFYTLDRTIYIQKENKTLVCSKSESPSMIDDAVWILEALEKTKASIPEWYEQTQNDLKTRKDTKTGKPLFTNEPLHMGFFTVSPTPARVFRNLYYGLRSHLYKATLSLVPGVKIGVGDVYEFEFKHAVFRWLPSLMPLKFPDVTVDTDDKLVAINKSTGFVAKMIESSEDYKHEHKMTLVALSILPQNVPQILASFEDYGLNLLLLAYTGDALNTWSDLSKIQLEKLLDLIQTLHLANLHHHDIRPPNVTVDQWGNVSLIDFGSSQMTTGGDECPDCEDEEVIQELNEAIRVLEEEQQEEA
ncbi:hypothetical protein K435DRAFT_852384 [Dendrothele bispora CBS 962.96]|uniref:Protein kinase domain-containing protein n=1 Tax=Dendrothele bispora (strain CBS 962.96) TaxID=1314807 RepID=A0A4S8MJI7_DENBC|nr:hypothetical protein K435DRAFT_852384 [Dendrothele bispora CBS 962.96]